MYIRINLIEGFRSKKNKISINKIKYFLNENKQVLTYGIAISLSTLFSLYYINGLPSENTPSVKDTPDEKPRENIFAPFQDKSQLVIDYDLLYHQTLIKYGDKDNNNYITEEEKVNFIIELYKGKNIIVIQGEKPRYRDGRIVPESELVKILNAYKIKR